MTFTDFLDYMRFEKKYSKHTVLAYQKDLENFTLYIKDEFEQEEMNVVNYSQIRSWIVDMVEQGLSNRTINRKVSSVKSYYKFLQQTGQIKANPLAKHRALKTSKKIQVPFSEKEVEAALSLFEEDDFETCRDKLMIELLYGTGIRRIELINLRVEDLDLSGKTIKVLGKRNKERIVPLLDMICDTARKYLKLRTEIKNNESVKHLLISEKGVKLNETFVYRSINNYFSQVSEKQKKSPHILRHSFATHLLNSGAGLNEVKDLLGHSSLAATQVYTHNNLGELNKVYKKAHPRNKK